MASGGYVFADTLEEDREQAEADAEKARIIAAGGELPETADRKTEDDLIGRETDESLGLTRELHLREAIEQELKRRQEEAGESSPIISTRE